MLRSALALVLIAHAVSSAQVFLGEFATCTSDPSHITTTPFGKGLLALRKDSRGRVKCGQQAGPGGGPSDKPLGHHATLDTAVLYGQPAATSPSTNTPPLKYCQVYADQEHWVSLLKVYIHPSLIPATEQATLTSQRVAEYAGEPGQPAVLVFASGDMFVPEKALEKASFKCDQKVAAADQEPVVPTASAFEQWGVRDLRQLQHRRIVSAGDFHGDLEHAKRVMRMARLVDGTGKWSGGKTVFVQTGDTVDRGQDTIEIVEWLESLIPQAAEAGGKVILLNGNHEIMNLAGDDRYISDEEKANPIRYQAIQDAFTPRPEPAPSPKGRLSRILLKRMGVVQVGTSVFLHGGLHPTFAAKGVAAVNNEIRNSLVQYCIDSRKNFADDSRYPVFGDNGPYWYRGYALDPERGMCPTLDKALTLLHIKRMVVGHTIQEDFNVNTRCNGKLVLQDVGMSRVYGKNHIGSTEIRDNTVWALGPTGWRVLDKGTPLSAEPWSWPAPVEPVVVG